VRWFRGCPLRSREIQPRPTQTNLQRMMASTSTVVVCRVLPAFDAPKRIAPASTQDQHQSELRCQSIKTIVLLQVGVVVYLCLEGTTTREREREREQTGVMSCVVRMPSEPTVTYHYCVLVTWCGIWCPCWKWACKTIVGKVASLVNWQVLQLWRSR
jgi:hypothetical protein